MSITYELRGAAHYMADPTHDFLPLVVSGDLLAIADRIDAEHQKALDEWKAEHGQMWLKGYSECHAELMEGNETLASDLERCGWVRLPIDADGVPIHVGDKMEFCAFDIEHPVKRTVDGIGKDVFFAWCGERGYQQHDAKRYRHYTPPTVEDILTEFHERMDELGTTDQCVGTDMADAVDALLRERAELVAEYAAKLRLAGEGE